MNERDRIIDVRGTGSPSGSEPVWPCPHEHLCTVAMEYCTCLDRIVVLNRDKLYRKNGFPLPRSTAEEVQRGLDLSGYFDRRRPPGYVELSWDD